MKIPSLSKQLSESSKSKKKIHKNKDKPKFLKYKPKLDDITKQWQIEAILNHRMMLKSQQSCNIKTTNKNSQMHSQSNMMTQQLIKEYQISWKQSNSKGIWPNTWQPQENIPEFTRLDYLLKKKNQLRNQVKTKRQGLMAKTKQNLQKHIQLTANKMIINPLLSTKIERRETIKKILSKNQIDKPTQKPQKAQNYKTWFISYNSRPEEFEKIIHKYMKGDKSQQSQGQQDLSKNKSVKYSVTKLEFLDSVPSQIKQPDILKGEQNVPMNKASQDQTIVNRSYSMPKDACNKFIKSVSYHVNLNQVDYFKLFLYDESVSYVSEQDLIQYFPFAYQKLLKKRINQSIQEAQQSLMRINANENNILFDKCFQKLGENLGFSKQDFDTFDTPQYLLDKKKNGSIFSQMSYIFGNRQFCIENSSETSKQIVDSYEIHVPYQNEKNKKAHIQSYFSYLRENAQQCDILQYESISPNRQFYLKPKFTQFDKFAECKQLFKNSNAPLKDQYSLNKIQITKNSEEIFQKEQLPKKERKIMKTEQKTLSLSNNIKIEHTQEKISIKKKEKQSILKEIIDISKESVKGKNLQKIRPDILSQENQINQILSVMQKPRKHSDDLYDSDDQESGR